MVISADVSKGQHPTMNASVAAPMGSVEDVIPKKWLSCPFRRASSENSVVVGNGFRNLAVLEAGAPMTVRNANVLNARRRKLALSRGAIEQS